MIARFDVAEGVLGNLLMIGYAVVVSIGGFMQQDVDRQLSRLTQSLVTLHRAEAKQLSTGPFSDGLRGLFQGKDLEDLRQHMEDCEAAISALVNLHRQRQQLLADAIATRRARQGRKRVRGTKDGPDDAGPI